MTVPASVLTTPFRPPAGPGSEGAGGNSVRHERVTVTPDMARAWLARNDSNRPLRYPFAAQLARDMTAGRWELNGETVKLAADGTVLDGQHRLTACVLAEVPFETFVVTGLPREAQDTIDTGRKRTMADVLHLSGERNAIVLASIARWALIWDRGGRVRAGSIEPTHAEMNAYLDANPELRDAANFAVTARRQMKSLRPVVFGMAWLLLGRKDPEQAQEFFARLLDGADIGRGHPVHTLRATIWRAREDERRLNEHEQLFLLVLAWNHLRAGNMACLQLKLPGGGLTPKNFPEPK